MYYRLKPRSNAHSKKNVVIVEDNKFMLTLLSNILSHDFAVKTFNCANEAKYWISNGNDVDVIISDIHMDQSNGVEFAKDIKTNASLSNIPFIFLTGMNESDLNFDSDGLKYEAFINKPFNPDTLIDRVKSVA